MSMYRCRTYAMVVYLIHRTPLPTKSHRLPGLQCRVRLCTQPCGITAARFSVYLPYLQTDTAVGAESTFAVGGSGGDCEHQGTSSFRN